MNENAYLRLIAECHGPIWHRLLRGLLRALSFGYGLAVRVRNRLFDCGVRRVHKPPVPVISVGNLTTGGTGKTPVVALLVRSLQKRGLRPGIVSRGYRSLSECGNDERQVLELLCPGVPHVQDPDRVAAAGEVSADGACDVIVADDAFQHRRLGRSLDVVLIDGLNPFGFDRLLPRGLLREPVSGLRRADVVIMTRADQTNDATRTKVWQEVARWRPDAAPIEIAFKASGLVSRDGEPAAADSLTGPVVAFCGIGNPGAFQQTLRDVGLAVAEFRTFPDHHDYATDELEDLVELAQNRSAVALITTLKDLVKLRGIRRPDIPLFALNIQAEVVRGSRELALAVDSAMPDGKIKTKETA